MAETSVMSRFRERLAGWLRPRPPLELRQPVIQFSSNLPQIIVAPASWSPRGPSLSSLIGHYADEIWVYIAVTKIAQSAASVPLRCRKGNPDDEDSDMVPTGPLPDLLKKPNEFQSPFDFIEHHQTSMELAGESFILLDRGPSAGAPPTAMYCLPIFNEETMKIIRGKTIRPDGPVEGYVYEVGGMKETFLPEEIIHIRYPNPFDPLRGMAPLRSAALSVSADLMAQQYNAAFFTNAAEPRGHYEAEGIVTEDQKKRFVAKLEAQHKGFRKAHRPLLLSNIKFVSTQLSPKDAEFLAQRKMSREEIIAIYGVRPVVVGLLEHNPQANAEVQWRDFWTATMMPKMTKLTNALNGELAPIFGEDLNIEWDYSKVGPLQENYSQKVGDAEKLWRMGYPINMINKRLNLGFDDVEWGDTVLVSPLLVPAEQMLAGNGNGNGNGNGTAVIEEEAGRIKLLGKPPAIAFLGASGGTVEERKRAALVRFEIRQTKNERRAKTKILDFFHAQERRTIRNLRSDAGTRALAPLRAPADTKTPVGVDISVVFNVKEETEKMQPVNREILRRALVESMLTFIAELGATEDEFDFVSDAVLKFLQTESFRQAKHITETTRDLLAKEFTEGINEGETIAELSARVERVFDERASSAETIARTETVGASNFGNQEAAVQADVQTKTWISSRDERVRDEHIEIDDRTTAEPILVTAPFRLKDGSELMYPGDSSMGADPGQIINCRCTLLYFFKD